MDYDSIPPFQLKLNQQEQKYFGKTITHRMQPGEQQVLRL
jgi:hypothetical protein